MFNLTLHDHLHLTFGQVIQRHNAHTLKAQSHARWGRRLRAGEALLMGGVTIAAAGAAYGHGQVLAIVAASMAGVALLVLLVQLTFDFDASARAHAACGAHLWGVRERYRSLLSDLHEGAIGVADARVRRDQLMDELRAIYETSSEIALVDPGDVAEEGAQGVRDGRLAGVSPP
jgi:hypothetical protein